MLGRWRWLTAIVLVGFGLRALYALWLHPIGDYLYSDMEGHYHAGQAFADPRHVFSRWDIVKPRAMGFIGGFILSHFKHGGLQVWGGLQVLLSTATLPLTFIFTNIFEWTVHKYVMHRPVNIKGLRAIYERHTLNHHQFFSDDEMRDRKSVV